MLLKLPHTVIYLKAIPFNTKPWNSYGTIVATRFPLKNYINGKNFTAIERFLDY